MLGYKAQSPTCFCGAVCTSIDHYTLSCAGTLSFRDRLVALLGVAISPGLYPSLLRDPRALEVLKEMVRLAVQRAYKRVEGHSLPVSMWGRPATTADFPLGGVPT